MNIKGYAGSSDEREVIRKYRDRYQEIHQLAELLNITKHSTYGRVNFSGELPTPETQALSELDLALIADCGNLCFGATCIKAGNKFYGSYYTD
jgi:hypothetical protein